MCVCVLDRLSCSQTEALSKVWPQHLTHVRSLRCIVSCLSACCGGASQGLQDVIGMSVTHPTWQRTRPDSEDDKHAGWAFVKPGDAPLSSTTGTWVGWTCCFAAANWRLQIKLGLTAQHWIAESVQVAAAGRSRPAGHQHAKSVKAFKPCLSATLCTRHRGTFLCLCAAKCPHWDPHWCSALSVPCCRPGVFPL